MLLTYRGKHRLEWHVHDMVGSMAIVINIMGRVAIGVLRRYFGLDGQALTSSMSRR